MSVTFISLPSSPCGGENICPGFRPRRCGCSLDKILLGMLHTKETRISSGHLGLWLMCAFTFLPGYRVQVVGLPWG